ncbi:MAG: sigma-70 family RNA polymerase sigma factor [Eubacteriales bacterium]|nr:sigma-70 family RNA polymerase sigma factor [Eubacteriales bacterium]MDD4324709.1 sigma-70 family RNA polymerase sigma factor [Eubacteriales bacterium]MDD4540557.1 sigma-70 family RNA polymerase sigma factor [Eubacteriales bacterium]
MAYDSCRPEEFEELVIKHENRLYRTALAIAGNRADAEDIVQEAFLRAYEKSPCFESEEHAKAWLIRVTINLCYSHLRSPWRRKTTTLLDSYPASDPKQDELIKEVMKLPYKYRTVIHLFYYEGYSIKEISELNGQRESTIRSQLTRARQKLKVLLEDLS